MSRSSLLLRMAVLVLTASFAFTALCLKASARFFEEEMSAWVGTAAVALAEMVEDGAGGLSPAAQALMVLQKKLDGKSVHVGFLDSNGKSVGETDTSFAVELKNTSFPQQVHAPLLMSTSTWRLRALVRLKTSTPRWLILSIGLRGFWSGAFARTLVVLSILISCCTVLIAILLLVYVFRAKAAEARAVLGALTEGKLGARFRISRYDELGMLMLTFNQMADRIVFLLKEKKASEEARTRLAGEISHDLRTPLTSVRVALETLSIHGSQLSAERSANLLALANKDVVFMQKLLEYFFALSKEGLPFLPVEVRHLDLAKLLREEFQARRTLEEARADAKQWELRCESEPLWISADRAMLVRLLQNLLDNARRHCRGRVAIEVQAADDHIVLLIGDDGPGIKLASSGETSHSRLNRTSPEHAANPDTSLGLGSSVIRAVVELHDWEYSVRTASDGTQVRICFPLQAAVQRARAR